MTYRPLFADSQNRQLKGKQIPMVSQDLDSIRSYQWEIVFYNVPVDGVNTLDRPITLAAKQVSQTGFQVEDIIVHRVNDTVKYPGKATTDELRVTFDNLYKSQMGTKLFQWIQSIYDPVTGEMTKNRSVGAGNIAGNFKLVCDVIQTSNTGQPLSYTRYYGVYPKSWKLGEWNYATNEFHTIEVSFSVDFIKQVGNSNT